MESTLARRLKTARQAADISQKTLGIRAGVDEFVASARINQYERGKHAPAQDIAARLAAVLKVPVSYLYEPDDDIAELIRMAGRVSKTRLRALLKELAKETGAH